MTWILKICAEHWREVAIALLFAGLTLSINHSRTLTIEYQDKETQLKIQLAKQEQSFATQVALAKEKENELRSVYASSVTAINAKHDENLKLAEQNAYRNYLARYHAAGNNGVSVTADTSTVRTTVSTATAESGVYASPISSDEASREFVSACARDAARVNEWIELCQLNHCEIVQ